MKTDKIISNLPVNKNDDKVNYYPVKQKEPEFCSAGTTFEICIIFKTFDKVVDAHNFHISSLIRLFQNVYLLLLFLYKYQSNFRYMVQ